MSVETLCFDYDGSKYCVKRKFVDVGKSSFEFYLTKPGIIDVSITLDTFLDAFFDYYRLEYSNA